MGSPDYEIFFGSALVTLGDVLVMLRKLATIVSTSQPPLEDEVFPLSFDSEASPGGLLCSAHMEPYLSAFQCTSVN